MIDEHYQFFISIYLNMAVAVTMLVATGINFWATWRNGRHVEGWLHTVAWGLLAGYALLTATIALINFVSPALRNQVIGRFMVARNIEALALLVVICALIVVPRLRPGLFPKSLNLFRAMAASGSEVRAEIERALQREAALERSNASLEKFAFAVSHDLRDPINRVRSMVSILREELPLDGEEREIMERIERAIGEAEAQVSGLLEFYRVNRDLVIQEVRLGDVLRSVLAMFGPFEIEIGPLPVVQADPRLVGIVLQNLLSNAVKFAAPDRPLRVTVRAETRGGWHTIRVADNGIGIEGEYLEEVFVIFKRLHGASEFPGTGLGLSLVQRIVEAHGGRVWAESREGGGSEFCFTLPAA